jgi:hypothetical protein
MKNTERVSNKPRNLIARSMFDRAGPYSAKHERNEILYRRQRKHRGSWMDYDERFYRDSDEETVD